MKLTNITFDIKTFKTINFKDRFCVITGESEKKDISRSHNLGKTTAVRLIEFVLFNGSGGFLKKIKNEYPDSNFTINYTNRNGEIGSFSRDFHRRKNGSIKEVQTLIEYEYFIRYQDEFNLDSGFRKPNFRGSDISWKPKLIELLGFNGDFLSEKLTLNNEVKELENVIKTILESKIKYESHQIEIDQLKKEKEIVINSINSLKFIDTDNADIKIIIEDFDHKIAECKSKVYNLKKEVNKIESSIERASNYQINTKDIERVFSEVNLYFEKQITKDINDLKGFYQNIYENRTKVLNRLLLKKTNILEALEVELKEIDLQRSFRLNELSNDDSKNKYKELYDRLVIIEKRISVLDRDIVKENVKELEKQLSKKQTESFESSANLSSHIDEDREVFNKINAIFSYIMKQVMNIEAEIFIDKKSTGNIDFLLKSYRNGVVTEELKGDTAKRISSAAIDIAIRSIQNQDHGFLIHDGVIDDVDINTANQFVKVVKYLANKYDFQYIMTALKDRLPDSITNDEVVLELNDYSDDGLLFGFRY